MTDRELLEKAAKAAGFKETGWQDLSGWGEVRYGLSEAIWTGESYWNPLTDDGDALRLAVKLGIGVGIDMQHEIVSAYAPNPDPRHFSEDAHELDPYACARRAIVRAAAAMSEAA